MRTKSDFASFCEYCIKDERTNEYIELQDFQIEWCELLKDEKRLVLFAPISSGKCIDADALITLENGARKKASEIVVGDALLSMNSNWKIEPTRVVAFECNGYRPLLQISTQSGRKIKVTAEHKFYILGEEWVPASRLKIGDRIATPRFLPVKTSEIGSDSKIELLGFLISEGYLANTPEIYNEDKDIVDRIKLLAQILSIKVSLHGNNSYRLCGEKKKKRGNKLTNWLKQIGLFGTNSYTKFIPRCIFTASKQDKALFLSALFSGDGEVSNQNHPRVSYSSVSKQLIFDLQTLLLHFGIVSQVHSRYTRCNNKEFLSYRLLISNKESLKKFKETIFYLYPKKNKGERLDLFKWDCMSKGQLDGVPVAWKKYQNFSDHYHREIHSYRSEISNFEVTSRERLKRIYDNEINDSQLLLDFCDQKTLSNLANSDIFWDKITSIENTGSGLTFDLQVNRNDNFIADNFITHNSPLISIAYPIWRLGNNPNLICAIVSNTALQASKFLQSIKEYILRDPDVRELFPDLKPQMEQANSNRPEKWTDYAIIVNRGTISKDFSIQALGARGPLMGAKLDLLIFDDVLDQENTESVAEREKTIRWHDSTAKSRLVNESQEVIIGTCWSVNDLMHYLESKPEYRAVKYSVEESDVELGYRLAHWPARTSRQKLEDEKRHNIREYNRQRRSRVAAEESQDFLEYVEKAIDKNASKLISDSFIKFTGVDLSTKKRAGTTIIDIAVSSSLKIVLDVEYGAWAADKKAQHIWAHYAAHKPRVVAVEDNAMQEDSIDWMIAAGYRDVPFSGFTTTGPKKSAGLTTLSIEFRNSLWRIAAPHFDESCSCDWCHFIKEIKYYPDYPTSDGLMALFFANEAARSTIGREPRVRTLNLSDDVEEELLLKNPKPLYDLSDYRPYHYLNPGFKPPDNYEKIVRAIQRNSDLSSFILEDVQLVRNDMQKFVEVLNK